MLTLLKIVGIIAVIVVVLILVAVRWFLRKLYGLAEENATVPCRIHPVPEPNPKWRHPTIVRQLAGEFSAAGFFEIGAFSIPEMAGLQFVGLFHPKEQFYGCIYDHSKLEPTFDVICRLVDQTSVTGTNTRLGESLDQFPGKVTLRLDKATVITVFDAVCQHPAAVGQRKPATAEAFLGYFTQAHAEYMNWRLAKGGASRDEIRRQATQDGQEVTDEQIDETYEVMREAYVEQLRDGCLAQYLDDARLSAADWERRQATVLAIPETLELKEVIETLHHTLELDDEQRHQLSQVEATFGQTGVDIIAGILDRQVASLGLTKVAEVREPVRAWILEQSPRTAPAAFEVGLSREGKLVS